MKIFRGELNRIRLLSRPFQIRQYLRNHDLRLLNVGSGPHKEKGWLTADKFSPDADIYLNVYAKLPFQDDTFDIIHSSHLIEHIKIDKIPYFLQEIYRVLKTNGLLRISTPDLELFAKNYIEKNNDFFLPAIEKYKSRVSMQKNKYWLVRSNGSIFMMRAVNRFYHHRWMYDYETLSLCLGEIGFKECIKQSFRKSIIDIAGKLDKDTRAWESLYIDAIK